jgi:hypothetical protein
MSQESHIPLRGRRVNARLFGNARRSTKFFACALSFSLILAAARPSAALDHRREIAAGDVSGTVTDSTSGQPLPSAEVSVAQNGSIVANTQTDGFGRYTVHNLGAGTYVVSARMIGFSPLTRSVTIAAAGGDVANVNFRLVPAAVNLTAVTVTAAVPIAVDTRTGNQVFQQNEYHGAPTNTTSQILQLSIAGAARAPTGEVHIRGQHAEYSYYVDGVPVPSGISGSLNELFDPQIVDQINFQTGGWDAEYGNKNAAIVNVTTKIPAGGFHGSVGTYVGTYDASTTTADRGFNGQSLSMSTNNGPWGFFVSGARQFSGMRIEPVILDPSTDKIANFHNQGTDYFGFGKIQFTPSTHDVLSLDMSSSRTRFQVPFDTTGNFVSDDHQTDVNSFANLGWRHQFGATSTAANSDLFAALYYRHGTLDFVPGAGDTPGFTFFPDPNQYNLAENRQFNTAGVKLDYTMHPSREVELKFGTQSSTTNGHENFVTTDANGNHGPSSNSGLKGWDGGVYAQTVFSPVEQFEVRTGVRYDAHNAPFAGTQSQVSPRIRLNFFPSPSTTLYAYYGRQFIPTNVEDLRAITSVALGSDATPAPTLPERDNFYEIGAIQRLGGGVNLKLSGYRKESSPGIDDNTVPGSAIVTSVNIDQVKVTGVEGVLEYRSQGALSAYLNAALNHAYGRGPITGGFFPEDTPQGFFDLDHDQRLSVVGSATYSFNRLYFSGTGIYGSGLTNGVDPADCDCFGAGLFDFNKGIHVSPSAIFNASAGYSLIAGASVLRPELYVENVFNKKYLLKGAFFSGASVGRPRSIQLRMNLGL